MDAQDWFRREMERHPVLFMETTALEGAPILTRI